MKIIDISVTISEDIKEPLPTKIVYEDHKEGAKKMGGKLFEGLTDVFYRRQWTRWGVSVSDKPLRDARGCTLSLLPHLRRQTLSDD